MADVSEIFKQLRNDLVADASLLALLGKRSKIYRKYPAGVHQKPFIILNIDRLNPQTQVDGTGEYRPDMTFDIIVLDPYDAGTIFTYLEENWSIPVERAAAIVSTDYRMDSLVFGDLIEVPGKFQETAGGKPVTMFSAQVRSRVIKVTA